MLETDSGSVFADVRHLIAGADIAAANLESPLTTRPHTSENANELEADPAAVSVLEAAGFDVMSLPNNHTMDAGVDGLGDTVSALSSAGIKTVGANLDESTARAPLVLHYSGISIGFLAFDTTGSTDRHLSRWEGESSLTEVRALRDEVDTLIVSLHGGTEYLPTTDPGLATIADQLAEAGVDVVWGHGAHVVQPVSVSGGDRPTVIATSLGNFLFDQAGETRTTGYLLEMMVDRDGVVAYRIGVTEHPDRRVELSSWLDPVGDSAWVDDSWWTLTRQITTAPPAPPELDGFSDGDVIAAAAGDIDGDGNDELVVSFRRPYRSTPFMEAHPEVQWSDSQDRSAHLGVFEPDDLSQIWVAGSVLMPIAELAVCDGAIAVVHDQLDDSTPVSTGAWTWAGFGFTTGPTLPGGGTPTCADINGDGHTDPVILNRR